jgi:HEAT repeat protein
MSWPLSQDYNEAIQDPRSVFSDVDLRCTAPVLNALGLPQPYSGNFADVYELRGPAGQGKWAVKCFTRTATGLQERYSAVSKCLLRADLPFTVEFQFLAQGMRIRGQWYPVVKMRWIDGLLLNDFVRKHLDQPAILDGLSRIWVRMGQRLRTARIAHGDLQHGNVLLVPGSKSSAVGVRLIDYDGMIVPALANRPTTELGHPSYQHPARLRAPSSDLEADRFALLVIACSLRALAVAGRPLWMAHDNGDNLLFRRADFEKPAESALLKYLWNLPDATTHDLVGLLTLALLGPLGQVPLLDDRCLDPARPAFGAEQEGRVAAVLGPGARVNRAAAAARETRSRPTRDRRRRRWPAVLGLGALLGLAALVLVVSGWLGVPEPQQAEVKQPQPSPREQEEPNKKPRAGKGDKLRENNKQVSLVKKEEPRQADPEKKVPEENNKKAPPVKQEEPRPQPVVPLPPPLPPPIAIDGKTSVAELIKLLRHPKAEVRERAAQALAELPDDRLRAARAELIDACRDGTSEIRRAVIPVLIKVVTEDEDSKTVRELMPALHDPDTNIRKQAAQVVGKIGKSAEVAVWDLVQLVANDMEAMSTRDAAAKALRRVGTAKATRPAIPTLLNVLSSKSISVGLRLKVLYVLQIHLVEMSKRPGFFQKLEAICDEARGEDITNRLLRYHTAYLLGRSKKEKVNARTLDVLLEYLKDTSILLDNGKKDDGRVMAVDALESIGADRVRPLPEIRQQLQALAKDARDDNLRNKASAFLLRLGKGK